MATVGTKDEPHIKYAIPKSLVPVFNENAKRLSMPLRTTKKTMTDEALISFINHCWESKGHGPTHGDIMKKFSISETSAYSRTKKLKQAGIATNNPKKWRTLRVQISLNTNKNF